jgi:CDP-glucose 4,6-dehydratase
MAKREGSVEALVDDVLRINPDPSFWKGRRVALTGHTGFKGAWLALLLHRLGAQVFAYALPSVTQPNLYACADIETLLSSEMGDIRDLDKITKWLKDTQAEVVFHLAAQALVRLSYDDPVQTFTTNFVGTLNLLEAVRQTPTIKSVLIVTTDKVYRNIESTRAYTENDHLGGHDPYSASKAACELLVASYRLSFLSHIGVSTARAGNVIGGGDWSQDRLIPDAVRAWQNRKPLEIRRPDSVRPWQHVLEPLCGYLILAQKMFADPKLGAAYNFGPNPEDALSVREVIELAQEYYGGGTVEFSQFKSGPHEAGLLNLNIALAEEKLGFRPRWDLSQALSKTMGWYAKQNQGANAYSLCMQDIELFLASL